jgi:hypothetical protein
MKSLLLLLAAAAFVSAAVIGYAQTEGASANPSPAQGSPPPDAAAPSPDNNSPGGAASLVPLPAAPAPSPQPGTPALENNMPLIPETVTTGGGKPGKGGKSRKSGGSHANASPGSSPHETFQVEEDIRVRVRLRQAQTEAMNAPEMQAEWAAAHSTRTDPQRRAALTDYYNHLYDRIIKIDPSIAANANLRRQAIITRMHYARLGDLPPSDDPYATPTPPASGKNPPSNDEPLPF